MRVLVVEDEEPMAGALRSGLEAEGFDIKGNQICRRIRTFSMIPKGLILTLPIAQN